MLIHYASRLSTREQVVGSEKPSFLLSPVFDYRHCRRHDMLPQLGSVVQKSLYARMRKGNSLTNEDEKLFLIAPAIIHGRIAKN